MKETVESLEAKLSKSLLMMSAEIDELKGPLHDIM